MSHSWAVVVGAISGANIYYFWFKFRRKELVMLANEKDMTMRAFVLDALKAKGLNATDDDLIDRRRR